MQIPTTLPVIPDMAQDGAGAAEPAALRARVAALEAHNERLERALRAGRIASFTLDLDLGDPGAGRQQAVYSPDYLALHGLPQGTAGETRAQWLARLHRDDRVRAERDLEDALAGRTPAYSSEFRIVWPADGSVRWIAARGEVERDLVSGRALRLTAAQYDVTDRRATEEVLHQVLEGISEAFLLLDRGFRVRQINAEALRIDGRTRERMLGRHMLELWPEAERAPTWSAFRRVLAEQVAVELIYQRPTTPDVWLEVRAYPAPDGVAVFYRDVSPRMRTEAALRASEDRYRTLAQTLPQLVWTCLPDGRCDYLSRQWVDYTGTPEREQLDLGWLDRVIHPEDRARTLEHWMGAVEGRHAYDIEYRIRRHDGVYRWFKTRGTPIRDALGRIGYWFGTCTDIEEIVAAREVLARSREELERLITERTRERDRLWRNARDLFLILGADGIIRAASPAWTTVLGWTPEEMVGRSYLDFVLSDDHRGSGQALALAAQAFLPSYENRYHHKAGGYRWISWVAAPEEGLVYATGRDITEAKAAAAELNAAQEQLRQGEKLQALGQLTGGIAHDFNNLLQVVASGARLLRTPRVPDERRALLLDSMVQAAENAKQLVDRLLAFARRKTLHPIAFDLNAHLRGMAELLRHSLGSRITTRTELAAELWPVMADIDQLEVALLNLAVNARHAMPAGGTLTIETGNAALPAGAEREAGEFVRLSVRDTGDGMAPQVLARAFEPFFTTKGLGKGTGLGLAQVHGFVKQSGGDIRLDSAPGAGTTVTIHLPRASGAAERAASVRRAETGDVHALRRAGGGTVLIVEDNPQVAAFTATMLEEIGYLTCRAGNAAEALALLEAGTVVEAVFSDIVMPGEMDGIGLADALRQRFPELAVVLATGYSEALARGQRAVAAEVLAKPYRPDELADALERALGRAR